MDRRSNRVLEEVYQGTFGSLSEDQPCVERSVILMNVVKDLL